MTTHPSSKVKRSFPLFGSELWIQINRKYSAEELLELMKQNFGNKYGPLEIKNHAILGNRIEVNGVGGYTIFVTPAGNTLLGHRIMVSQMKKTKPPAYTFRGCLFGIILNTFHIFTFDIVHWQIWGARKNWHIMNPLSMDIAKIVQ
jgi:hypothetical protein